MTDCAYKLINRDFGVTTGSNRPTQGSKEQTHVSNRPIPGSSGPTLVLNGSTWGSYGPKKAQTGKQMLKWL